MKRKQVSTEETSFTFVGGRDFKPVQQAAWDAGWRPVKKKSGLMWRSPDGVAQVLIHGTSSDHRALKNTITEFRRGGLDFGG